MHSTKMFGDKTPVLLSKLRFFVHNQKKIITNVELMCTMHVMGARMAMPVLTNDNFMVTADIIRLRDMTTAVVNNLHWHETPTATDRRYVFAPTACRSIVCHRQVCTTTVS